MNIRTKRIKVLTNGAGVPLRLIDEEEWSSIKDEYPNYRMREIVVPYSWDLGLGSPKKWSF